MSLKDLKPLLETGVDRYGVLVDLRAPACAALTTAELIAFIEERRPVGVTVEQVLQAGLESRQSITIRMQEPTFNDGWDKGFKRGMEHAIEIMKPIATQPSQVNALGYALDAAAHALDTGNRTSEVWQKKRQDTPWYQATADEMLADLKREMKRYGLECHDGSSISAVLNAAAVAQVETEKQIRQLVEPDWYWRAVQEKYTRDLMNMGAIQSVEVKAEITTDRVPWTPISLDEPTAKACDCGGAKARTTHSDWCSSHG